MSNAKHPAGRVRVVALSHDLVRQRSIVSIVWLDDPEKSVALPVPFGCPLEDIDVEAEKALRALSDETARLVVES